MAADILEGRYEFPENFDQATRELGAINRVYAKEGDSMERYDKGQQAQSPDRFVHDG